MGIISKLIEYISGAEISSAAKAPIYRVRKSWNNPKSQIGAYKVLTNAKKACDAHKGYYVFDASGKAVYPIDTPKATTYRVRKTWADSKSQIGAYKILANAKKACDAHKGYSVYDENGKAVYTSAPAPTQTIIDKELDACKVQAEWMKNYKYSWEQNPTIEKSKKKGTCVTYVACVLQRIGVLKSGQCVWINNSRKVVGANSKMTVTYMSGTLKSNKAKLKKGDIVIGGNGKPKASEGSHIFVLTGKWSGDNPYIYDQGSANRVKQGKSPQHTWKGSFPMIALIRLK